MTAINPRIFRERHFAGAPAAIDGAVRHLCCEIAPAHEPVYVECRPEGVVRECFFNVRSKVERDGGESVSGWAIWEWRQVMVEAEHHAVWRAKDGRLVDVTPHEPPCGTVLFLPDPGRTYDYATVARLVNIKRSHGVIAEAQAYIDAAHSLQTFVEAHSVGRVVNMPRDQFEALQDAKVRAQCAVLDRLARRTGPHDLCICDSGRKFKRCCRQFIALG